MIAFGPLPQVAADELLARFVAVEKWIRADNTIRQDAFIPPRDLNLSVTRHRLLSEEQLWEIGQTVANAVSQKQPARLFGRADVSVAAVAKTALRAEAVPVAANPNHAHIIGWPQDKPKQKFIAQQLAAAATFVAKKPL